ncbi:MAG: 4-hydroxyphenylpyruvate dioxygenase family protein, partial [Microcoleus sp.]
MEFDRIYFYVENARESRDWFVGRLGFQTITGYSNSHTRTEIIGSGNVCFVLSSPLTPASPAASWLKFHPPGIADVGFRVKNIELAVARAAFESAKIIEPICEELRSRTCVKRAKIAGWGDLSHTLVEGSGGNSLVQNSPASLFAKIDHVVLNVEAGDLDKAVNWYQKILGFEPQQNFDIQTDKSALRSQVLIHPEGGVQLPINEPASTNSQIQEFLDANRGPGIQHMALQTNNIV